MKSLKNIFWNSEQHRIRTGFRLTVQFILYVGLTAGLGAALTTFGPHKKLSSDAPMWFFLCYACILLASGFISTWLTGRFLDRRPYSDFGFHFNKNWWIDLSFGMALGGILMALIFTIELTAGWLTISDVFYMENPDLPFFVPILVFFFVFISVALSEELLSRGYILKNLSEGLTFGAMGAKRAILIAWILSSIVFGLLHLGNPHANFISTSNIIIAGMFLGLGYILTGELAIPIGLHISWNFFEGNIFGFPVSGNTIPAEVVTFIKIEQMGPELWTGGAFGPEAGLLGLGTMLLGMGAIVGWIRFRRGSSNGGNHLLLANSPGKNTSESL